MGEGGQKQKKKKRHTKALRCKIMMKGLAVPPIGKGRGWDAGKLAPWFTWGGGFMDVYHAKNRRARGNWAVWIDGESISHINSILPTEDH